MRNAIITAFFAIGLVVVGFGSVLFTVQLAESEIADTGMPLRPPFSDFDY